MSDPINDPELYRKMSVPFESLEDAQSASNSFFEEVAALREKYKIPDIIAIARFSFMMDGQEAETAMVSTRGDFNLVPHILGQAYKAARRQMEARLDAAAGEVWDGK